MTVSDAAGNTSPQATANTTKTGGVVTVTATDSNGSEQGPDTITFVVTRSGDTTASLTVAVTWSGAATFAADYTVSSNASTTTVTIAAGLSSATITVTPVNDTAVESTEGVTLTVNSGNGYTVGTPSIATGSITDNDGVPSVSIAATDASGAEQGSDPVVFTVTRSVNLFSAITVGLGWSGTATRGTDYTVSVTGGTLSANQLQLTLNSGIATATITLTPVDDTTIESTETAILTLNSGTGYTVGAPASATGSIADNDALAVVTVSATKASGAEQGSDPIDFTVTRTTNTIKQLVFNLTWSGTATFGTDYTVTAIGGTLSANKLQLTLASGVSSAIVRVTPVDDSVVESSETVVLTLASGTGYTVGSPSSGTGTIADNDGTPSVTIVATDGSGAEQASDAIVFTITRAVNPYTPITVNLTWGGAATYGTDYTVGVTGGTLSSDGSTITLAAGATSATVTVTPIDDTISEGAESVTLTIATGAGYSVGTPASASATIADNEPAPPPPPTISSLPANSISPVPISGTGIAGAMITLYEGTTQIGPAITVAANGTWSTTLSLLPGTHTIGARQTSNGLTSQLSATVTTTVYAQPPAPLMNQPSVGSVKKNIAPVTVTGTGVTGYTITLYDGATVIGTTTVLANGNWTLTVNLASGTHSLTATQTQVAGVTSLPSSPPRSVTVP